MDFILFMMLLNLMLFSPNLMDYLDKIQVTVTKPVHENTVSTEGVPYYLDTVFVKYLEVL